MMTGMAKHAPAKSGARGDVWFVLVITGGTSATLNVWHAMHAGGAALLIALLVGIVPVSAAVGLSHVVASHRGAQALRVVTFAVMLATMAVSIGAIAAVVRPIEGAYFCWVFGFALDAAALACVWVLLGEHDRKAAETVAMETAQREAEAARAEAGEAAAEAARLEAELVSVKAALEAERARRVPGRKPRRSSGRKPAGTGTRKLAPAATGSSGPEAASDIDAEIRTDLRIMELIEQGHSASEAGILAGASDSYGRQVARMHKAAKKEPAGDERTDGDMATGEQPRVG